MAQPFKCFCGTPKCRGTISGAKDMTPAQLEGYWLNSHIRELMEDSSSNSQQGDLRNGTTKTYNDPTAQALRDALIHAEQVVEAARSALRLYVADASSRQALASGGGGFIGEQYGNGIGRRGPTSREMSGEMGGDTKCV